MTPLALLGWAARSRRVRLPFFLRWAGIPLLSDVLFASAIGEWVADKLPITPGRTIPPALASRIVLGAICGASHPAPKGRAQWSGALAGALGALLGSYAGEYSRAWVGRQTGLPDQMIASVEELTGVALTLWAIEE
jgi:uncharacterized membrane protein